MTSAAEAKRISAAAPTDSKARAGKLFTDGFALLQKNEYQAALNAYTESLTLDPGNASARYYFGLAHSGLGNGAAARAQYEFVIGIAPDFNEGAIAKGILLELDEKRSETVDGCW